MKSKSFIAGTAVLAYGCVAHAATILVPGDYLSIQQAIAASVDGDTVPVAPGIYSEQIDSLDRQITVQSVEGPATTTIDASYFGPVVHFGPAATRQAVLREFTITHGLGATDGGWDGNFSAQSIFNGTDDYRLIEDVDLPRLRRRRGDECSRSSHDVVSARAILDRGHWRTLISQIVLRTTTVDLVLDRILDGWYC